MSGSGFSTSNFLSSPSTLGGSDSAMPSVFDAASMAADIYSANSTSSWTRGPLLELRNGFGAAIYRSGSISVVSYRGTANAADAIVDASMVPPISYAAAYETVQQLLARYGVSSTSLKSKVTSIAVTGIVKELYNPRWMNRVPIGQTDNALDFYDKAMQSGDVAFVVGHSLGGALAQTVSMKRDARCVAFNSPFMGDLLGTTAMSSVLNLCVNTDGDPLSTATRLAGNLPHGRVITVPIPPYTGKVPIRAPMAGRGLRAVAGMLLTMDPEVELQNEKVLLGLGEESARYAADFAAFLKNVMLYYHSMDNLLAAIDKDDRFHTPIGPDFSDL